MHVLYEEDGELKVGNVLASAPASHQVESPHGRRSKVKASNVVLTFDAPAPAELLARAQEYAAGLDTDFLWQCCGPVEFGFAQLARDYVGREPSAIEAAGVLFKLHAAPMYFYRRGKGRFQAANEQTLKLALAGLEKKRRLQERIAEWTSQLARGEFPAELRPLRAELLYAPDRNKPETKALEAACKQTGLSVARLFERCGELRDTRAYHFERFLFEFFPAGTAFPPHPLPEFTAGLPLAAAEAFSLDDGGTTEIDDAFSLSPLEGDGWRLGIHISAPALGFAPGSALDAIARERLSTVYMPGNKITMLPEDAVAALSLDAGTERPVVSLYFDVSPGDYSLRGRFSRIERVRIAANLRHELCTALNETLPKNVRTGLPFEAELEVLWRIAMALEKQRGKPSVPAGITDYTFTVEDDHVSIEPRLRGAPLDQLVSELMILANSSWGELLAERDVAAIYRTQGAGKVRMAVHPEPHEGLGVACYAWMTSPLRRYVDLANQWQLVASLAGKRAPFARTSEELLSALRAFEVVYVRYDEFQRQMEQYWCLRWMQQETLDSVEASVVRENLVRVDRIPLTARVASLPELPAGARVRLAVGPIDLIERTLVLSYTETLRDTPREIADAAALALADASESDSR
jgi:exoribonuclease-2